ncbi:cellulase family glycosylhydrolase [Candidatus Gracilibacteria bacterium]|nr:cellulase family glycosylhydrolase [Candidatus Gracilibacteria bacterium]
MLRVVLLLIVLVGLAGFTVPQARPVAQPAAQPAPPTATAAPLQPGGFIQVRGSELTRLGEVVRLKGANYYPQGKPWSEMWYAWDGPQIARELKLGRDTLGLNAIRILLPYKLEQNSYAAGVATDTVINRLREITQIAGDLDMRLIVTLFDFYEDFPLPDTREERENIVYLETLLGNFAGDDRIAIWDLHNEPDHYKLWAKEKKAQQVLGWLGRMADTVHRLAPNQLVTVGMGQYDNLYQPGPDGRRVVDYSDVVSIHIYNAADALRQFEELRTHTAKPILLEEFGWPTGPRCVVAEYTEASQEWVYKTILAAAEGRVAGVVAWNLRDYHAGPTRRYDTREEHYGLIRADDSLKPAAAIFAAFPAAALPSATKSSLPLSQAKVNQPGTERAPWRDPNSGLYLKGEIRQAYDQNNGPVSLGRALSEVFVRPGDGFIIQYFERGVLEINPQRPRPPDADKRPIEDVVREMVQPQALGLLAANGKAFPEGKRELGGEFRTFYKGVSGEWRLGAAISPPFDEVVGGQARRVQYFERGRLEINPATGQVEPGTLGLSAWEQQCRSVGQ